MVAVDSPSGIGDEFRAGYPALRADLTLTVAPAKIALYLPAARPFCGRIRPVAIGFPPAVIGASPGTVLMDRQEAHKRILPFPPQFFKNRRGHSGVFGGSVGTAGAALLATEAAARGGAGLVTLFVDPDIYTVAAAQVKSAMVRPWEGEADLSGITCSSCVIGPGWGTGDGRNAQLAMLLGRFERGLVDADGLNLLARTNPGLKGEWVLTPHPGECARLLGTTAAEVLADPTAAAREAAGRYGAVVLLKGHVSFCRIPRRRDRRHRRNEPPYGDRRQRRHSGRLCRWTACGIRNLRLRCRRCWCVSASGGGTNLRGRERAFYRRRSDAGSITPRGGSALCGDLNRTVRENSISIITARSVRMHSEVCEKRLPQGFLARNRHLIMILVDILVLCVVFIFLLASYYGRLPSLCRVPYRTAGNGL